MRQILQDLNKGATYLEEVPTPNVGKNQLLIQTTRSLISAGTERMLVEFGRGNLISKAKSQPEKVKQVLDKMKADGILPTLEAVFSKLNEPLPLGYCNVGKVIEIGRNVNDFKIGDRVISNGPHAEVVAVGQNLCAKIPDNVTDEEAAFTVLSSIALQGIRLVNPTIGETIYVSGLGLIGLITVQLLQANGCRVIGGDFHPGRLAIAESLGCRVVNLGEGGDPVQTVLAETDGNGADAVIITASTSSNEPMHQAATMSRKCGRIVLVGVVGLELNRSDFYDKELTFQVSCSYGPGRYDSSYEEEGNDYPFGFVRWTEQRNFRAILDLMSSGKLQVSPLITDRIKLENAPEAYNKLLTDKNALGIVLEYKEQESELFSRTVKLKETPSTGNDFAILGAGNFTTRTVLPALKKKGIHPKVIASAGGRTAAVAAKKFGIPSYTTDIDSIFKDDSIGTVFIMTRHNNHADLVVKALESGKHVFVEKPLAIDREGLEKVKTAYEKTGGKQHLMVGFNRRYSPHVLAIKKRTDFRSGPLCMNYTVNAGMIPKNTWVQDLKVGGGRIIGEGCHFIDLLRYLAGSPIIDIKTVQVKGSPDGIDNDKMSIIMSFEDGSIGTVNYWANGSKSYPKETLEVFVDESVFRMDNYRKTSAWGAKGFKTIRTSNQDKGHADQFSMFLDRIKSNGAPLIAPDELFEVTEKSLMIAL